MVASIDIKQSNKLQKIGYGCLQLQYLVSLLRLPSNSLHCVSLCFLVLQFLGARMVFFLVFGKHPGDCRHSHTINNHYPGCWNAHLVHYLHGCTFCHLLFSPRECPMCPAVYCQQQGNISTIRRIISAKEKIFPFLF